MQLSARCAELQRQVELHSARSPSSRRQVQEQATQTEILDCRSVGSVTDALPAQISTATQASSKEFSVSAATQSSTNTSDSATQVQPDRLSIGAQVYISGTVVQRRDAVCSATLDDEFNQKRRLELLRKIDDLLVEAEGHRNQLKQELDMRRKVEGSLESLHSKWGHLEEIVQSKAWSLLPTEVPLSRMGNFIGCIVEFCGRGDFATLIMPSLDSYLAGAANSACKICAVEGAPKASWYDVTRQVRRRLSERNQRTASMPAL